MIRSYIGLVQTCCLKKYASFPSYLSTYSPTSILLAGVTVHRVLPWGGRAANICLHTGRTWDGQWLVWSLWMTHFMSAMESIQTILLWAIATRQRCDRGVYWDAKFKCVLIKQLVCDICTTMKMSRSPKYEYCFNGRKQCNEKVVQNYKSQVTLTATENLCVNVYVPHPLGQTLCGQWCPRSGV